MIENVTALAENTLKNESIEFESLQNIYTGKDYLIQLLLKLESRPGREAPILPLLKHSDYYNSLSFKQKEDGRFHQTEHSRRKVNLKRHEHDDKYCCHGCYISKYNYK